MKESSTRFQHVLVPVRKGTGKEESLFSIGVPGKITLDQKRVAGKPCWDTKTLVHN